MTGYKLSGYYYYYCYYYLLLVLLLQSHFPFFRKRLYFPIWR